MSEPTVHTPTTTAPTQSGRHDTQIAPLPDMIDYMKEYARQKPDIAAMWCFGIGFVLGWKLKPW